MKNGLVIGHKLEEWWIDTGGKNQILEANSLILEEIINGGFSKLYKNYERNDNLMIGLNVKTQNVKVNGYAIIGHDSTLISTNLDNNVAISNNSYIRDSVISNSIILEKIIVRILKLLIR